MTKIVFAHGMEGSPEGNKANYLRREFGAIAPWLGELGLEGQVNALAQAVGEGDPAVVVGSSLGGLAALGFCVKYPAMVHHLLLLAPAVGMHRYADVHPEAEEKRPGLFEESRHFGALAIPRSISATILHGIEDAVINVDDVVALATRSPSSRLVLVHDDHSLHQSRELILSIVGRAACHMDSLLVPRT